MTDVKTWTVLSPGLDDTGSAEIRVTVVIPCFKQEVFLFECLNSLIAQTMPSWEAFVVDDCSPNRIVDRIVAGYDDTRIRFIRHDTNLGLAASRNTGLQAGHAPFALCVDADDFLHPEFLSTTLDAIERLGADCVYTEFQLVGLSNDVWTWEVKSADELAEVQWIPGPGVLMRRLVWERVGGYSEELRWNEDWDFWIAAMAAGCSFERVPRPLYFYRRHSHTMTNPITTKNEWRTRDAILRKRAAFFAIGDRARVFRTGGLISSAYAHRALGNRWRWAALTARAISLDPRLIYPEAKAVARALARKAKRKIKNLAGVDYNKNSDENTKNAPARDWDSLASALHNRFSYLSHDFSILGQVIDKTEARSVLEVGCGSGRLVPVYLTHNVQTILLQDMSARALDLCRQRFFCQEQIRYFHGSVRSIPISASPDLVVANRILQYILDDAEFRETMNYLTSMARYLYVNEVGIEEPASFSNPDIKGRDYAMIFRDLGWRAADRGELTDADGMRQSWILFGSQNEIGSPRSAAHKLENLDVQHQK
jgi:GT2 family glycosyltransferase/SAM-dependent methyltransferase